MKINKVLERLDSSWSREEILLKLKNGTEPEYIVNEFINKNQNNLEKLSNLFRPRDKELLIQIEKLSTIEAKLINKIYNLSTFKNEINNIESKRKENLISKKPFSYKLGLFLIKWSNKFVFIALLTISAIALSKQAWA